MIAATPLDWSAQQEAAQRRAIAGGGAPGLARMEQLAGKSGREILEAMMSGELPYPPMNETTNLVLLDQVAALLLDGDEADMGPFLQMERQRIAGHIELRDQHAGREPLCPRDKPCAEHPQALGAGQSASSGNSLIFVHISKIQQILHY